MEVRYLKLINKSSYSLVIMLTLLITSNMSCCHTNQPDSQPKSLYPKKVYQDEIHKIELEQKNPHGQKISGDVYLDMLWKGLLTKAKKQYSSSYWKSCKKEFFAVTTTLYSHLKTFGRHGEPSFVDPKNVYGRPVPGGSSAFRHFLLEPTGKTQQI